MLTLYGYWRSPACYRVRTALNLKKLKYDFKCINLIKNGGDHHSLEYRILNPQGLVPCLIDKDSVIPQSMAILEYLEEQYTNPPLLPISSDLKAQIRAFCHNIICDIQPLHNLRVLQHMKAKLDLTEQQQIAWYQHWIYEGLTSLESYLSRSKLLGVYCFGNTVTLADVCLIPQLYNAQRFNCNLDSYPILNRIYGVCLALPEFNEAAPENQPDAPKNTAVNS